MSEDRSLRVACVQLTPQDDLAANVAQASELIAQAARQGAQLILLPEYAALLHASGRFMREHSPPEAGHPALAAFAEAARATGTWILVGSLTVPISPQHLANRSYCIDGEGRIVAHYDKLHLFDATLPSGRVLRESSTYAAGSDAVAVTTPWGLLGMSVCYDLRFPQLYRALAQAGCSMIAVPSAFTRATGERHWHALLRARAIENACYILAPATCGTHPGAHETFGHTLIVSPDGAVLQEGGTQPGLFLADLDLAAVDGARQAIPSLTHDRPIAVRTITPAPSPTRGNTP
jgi:predicted amidohydrolase